MFCHQAYAQVQDWMRTMEIQRQAKVRTALKSAREQVTDFVLSCRVSRHYHVCLHAAALHCVPLRAHPSHSSLAISAVYTSLTPCVPCAHRTSFRISQIAAEQAAAAAAKKAADEARARKQAKEAKDAARKEHLAKEQVGHLSLDPRRLACMALVRLRCFVQWFRPRHRRSLDTCQGRARRRHLATGARLLTYGPGHLLWRVR